MFLAYAMRLTHVGSELLVILAQFREHRLRRNTVRVVVRQALPSSDIADGVQRICTDLPDALSERVCRSVYLLGVLIEQRVVIAKVRP